MPRAIAARGRGLRSEEHTSELQSPCNLVCRLLLEKKNRRTAARASLSHYYCHRSPSARPLPLFPYTPLFRSTRMGGWSGDADMAGVLRSVKMDQGGNELVVEYQNGRVVRFDAEGDCCSRSWIEIGRAHV